MDGQVTSSRALWSAQAHMPTVLGRQIEIVGGDGAYVTTSSGQRLLDGTAGLWHANVGHGREELARAAYDQMRKLETYHVFGRFVNDAALALADRVAAYSPFADAKVILTSGGSDSVDSACKLARRHWQIEGQTTKKIILYREYAYHGVHGYGTSVAGLQFNRDGYGSESLIPETARVDNSNINRVEAEILRIGADNIAAIIVEPVMGTGGVIPPAPGYLEGLQRLAAEHNILIIADEVITGFGRTGAMFACERYAFTPDLLLMAKGITSGYAPLGGILVAPRVWKNFYEGSDAPIYRHGTTYSGHATACAVASANLDILEQEGLVHRAGELGLVLDRALDRARSHELIEEVRVGGFLGGVQLAQSVDGNAVVDFAIENGVIVRILRGNTVQISPPFIVTEAEISTIVDVVLAGAESQAKVRAMA
ncbi:MAG TPA: aminotransferase class III-fold pyridoxal phosphate-dependent enzyme [Candidatus Nanopelagicaceae bacterium]